MLDVRRALEFQTEDPKAAEKIALGAIVLLAPILSLAAFGYQVEVARRVSSGEPQPLPEWSDLGRLWLQGARLGLAYFIYSLPVFLMMLSGMALVFVGLILSVQSDSAQSGGALAPPLWVLAVFVLLALVALLYGVLLGLLRPAVLAEYAQRGTFQACFDFGAMLRFIRQNLGEYLKLWLAELVLGWLVSLPLIVLVFILGLVPFVGTVLVALVAGAAGFFLLLVSSHMVGQLLRARPQSSS